MKLFFKSLNYFFIQFCFLSILCGVSAARAKGLTEEGAYVYDSDKKILRSMSVNQDLTFDHITSLGFEVYGPRGLISYLAKMNIPHMNTASLQSFDYDAYPDPEEINDKIRDLQKKYPRISELVSIGSSVEGRKILGLKISDNPEKDELEPEFKYISSMHGDEITGREILVLLAEDLLKDYEVDSKITDLINNTEIYIIPSMNPDGSAAKQRGNANNFDLNRDFPDFTTADNQNTLEHRQIETQLFMQFQKQRNFSLSANFHGGAEVVNYAWDTTADKHPFHDILVEFSQAYASQVDYMYSSLEFENGITNGYEWYEVNSGMQDWSYYWHNDLQFTIELSLPKWPLYEDIAYYYQKNKNALISFIANIHQGAGVKYKHFVNNQDIAATLNGKVLIYRIEGEKKIAVGEYPFFRSEFYKVLPLGLYEMTLLYENGESVRFIMPVDKSLANYGISEFRE